MSRNTGKTIIKTIAACAALCIAAAALMGAAENPECKTVEKLLRQRTSVMDEMLMGSITFAEGEARLKQIETGSLYQEDIRNLHAYEDSDFEKVERMDIRSLTKEGEVYDVLHFRAEIRWTHSGYDGIYRSTVIYDVSVSCRNGEYRLTSLEIQE